MNDLPPIAERMSLAELAARVGRTYGAVHGWGARGVKTPNGTVRLRVGRLGGTKYTTQQWVDEFLRACEGTAAETAGQRAPAMA
jgi:hypothetical protein